MKYNKAKLLDLMRREIAGPGGLANAKRVASRADGLALCAAGILSQIADRPGITTILGPAPHLVGAILTVSALQGEGFLVCEPASGATVVLADVVATDIDAITRTAAAIEERGCLIARICVVLDNLNGGREALSARGYDFRALLTTQDLEIQPAT